MDWSIRSHYPPPQKFTTKSSSSSCWFHTVNSCLAIIFPVWRTMWLLRRSNGRRKFRTISTHLKIMFTDSTPQHLVSVPSSKVAHQAPLSMKSSRQEYWSGCSLLQGVFPTQWLNPDLLDCRQILYYLSYQERPRSKYYLTKGEISLVCLSSEILNALQNLNWWNRCENKRVWCACWLVIGEEAQKSGSCELDTVSLPTFSPVLPYLPLHDF